MFLPYRNGYLLDHDGPMWDDWAWTDLEAQHSAPTNLPANKLKAPNFSLLTLSVERDPWPMASSERFHHIQCKPSRPRSLFVLLIHYGVVESAPPLPANPISGGSPPASSNSLTGDSFTRSCSPQPCFLFLEIYIFLFCIDGFFSSSWFYCFADNGGDRDGQRTIREAEHHSDECGSRGMCSLRGYRLCSYGVWWNVWPRKLRRRYCHIWYPFEGTFFIFFFF